MGKSMFAPPTEYGPTCTSVRVYSLDLSSGRNSVHTSTHICMLFLYNSRGPFRVNYHKVISEHCYKWLALLKNSLKMPDPAPAETQKELPTWRNNVTDKGAFVLKDSSFRNFVTGQ